MSFIIRNMNIFLDLFLTFSKIGAFTFGGGYAMISLIDHECVEKRQWLTSEELMDMTVVAESTPGPIAINCATFAGYKKAGFMGALVASLGMTLPSFIIILFISGILEHFLSNEIVAKAFSGIRIAVAVLIIRAAVKMIGKMLKSKKNALGIVLTAVFFLTLLTLNILGIHFSTIYFILIAGVIGIIMAYIPHKKVGAQ